MSILKSFVFDEICSRRVIRDRDVAHVSEQFHAAPTPSADEALALLSIHRACPIQDPSWSAFLVDAISEFVVKDMEPRGYLTVDNVRWLLRSVTRDARVRTLTEFDICVAALSRARWAPERLSAFLLQQVHYAVRFGDGPLRTGAATGSTRITAGDARLIAEIFTRFATEPSLPLTQRELSALLALSDTCAEDRSPLFERLLIMAIASAALYASGYTVPGRDRLFASIEDEDVPAHDAGAVVSPLLAGLRRQTGEDRQLAALEVQRVGIITGDPIGFPDATSLARLLAGRPAATVLDALKAHGVRLADGLAACDRAAQAA